MNREEAIQFIKDEMFVGENKVNELYEAVERLEQPPTLAEFLGWEEGVKYEYKDDKGVTESFIIKDNELGTMVYNVAEHCMTFEPLLIRNVRHLSKILRQATKVEEPKSKAWRVRDKYSYDCLMEELEEQGFKYSDFALKDYAEKWPIIYLTKDSKINEAQEGSARASMYDIMDYYKEEPKYYAKIKGWDNGKLQTYNIYWNYCCDDETVLVSSKTKNHRFKNKYTKSEWNELGINDKNADFEEVEE